MSEGLNIIIPKFNEKSESMPDWVERTMRNGCFLHEYLRREKLQTPQRMREMAKVNQDYKRKPGCEHNLVGVMDVRTWMRWQLSEPGIMEDVKEYRKLARDNPEMTPWK